MQRRLELTVPPSAGVDATAPFGGGGGEQKCPASPLHDARRPSDSRAERCGGRSALRVNGFVCADHSRDGGRFGSRARRSTHFGSDACDCDDEHGEMDARWIILSACRMSMLKVVAPSRRISIIGTIVMKFVFSYVERRFAWGPQLVSLN